MKPQICQGSDNFKVQDELTPIPDACDYVPQNEHAGTSLSRSGARSTNQAAAKCLVAGPSGRGGQSPNGKSIPLPPQGTLQVAPVSVKVAFSPHGFPRVALSLFLYVMLAALFRR
jgi:hypothetical protein